MKNGNDNLKEKAIKANELENVSGGSQAGTSVKYEINARKCFDYQFKHIINGGCSCERDCERDCDRKAISHYYYNAYDINQIDPNLCDGCGKCNVYVNYHCKAFKRVEV